MLGCFLRHWDGQKFAYGVSDCLQYSGAWINELTGENPAEPYRETYSNEFEAAKLLKRLYNAKGGDGVTAALDALCDPVKIARSGDFVLTVGIDGKPASGILNETLITAQGSYGLVSLPAQRPLHGWRVRKVD